MVAQLSKAPLPLSRGTLAELVDLRLREGRTLFEAGLYVGTVYVAGYAVECRLKLAICTTLDWDQLLATFRTHDLELLMLHSGLDRRLQREAGVRESFSKIRETWKPDAADSVRYSGAARIDKRTASLFLDWVADSKIGVIPWLQRMTS